MAPPRPKALIAGASCALGLLYADRLARRGHDLVLFAPMPERPARLAGRLHAETAARAEILTGPAARLAETVQSRAFDLVVNNLHLPPGRPLTEEPAAELDRLIDINVRDYAQLSAAAARSLLQRGGGGALINIASAVGLAPEAAPGAFAASQAFAIALTRSMQHELAGRARIQLVLAAATRTDLWPFDGCATDDLPGMMPAATLVDAALAGFDLGEAITLPSLAEAGRWTSHERTRHALLSGLVNSEPARRYRRPQK